jgi:hypothetical protein
VPSSANKIKLGELLIDAGVITSGDLTEAIQVSRRLGVPIGQALLVSRCVTDNVLEASLEAQTLIKAGTVPRSAAVDALRRSSEDGRTLRTFLDIGEANEDTHQTSKRLAELLLDSEIVTQDQVDQALMTSYSSGMPLGSALVLEGVLSPSLFPSILRIQRNIREGKVGREAGIDELRSTFLHWIKAEESLARAAEMEDAADVYSQEEEDEIIQAAEQSVQMGLPSFAPPMYTQPTFTAPAQALRQPDAEEAPAKREHESFGLQESQSSAPRLIDLLKDAGAINHQEVQAAFDRILEDPVASGKLLKLLGVASEEAIKTAMKSHSLIERQQLTDQQAIDAIKEVRVHHEEIDDENEDSEQSAPRRARDRAWRKSTATKVLGGIAVGAAVAGISSLFKRGKGN